MTVTKTSPTFHETTMMVKVKVRTQFGPSSAVELMRFLDLPAVESIEVEVVETSYVPLTPQDVNRAYMPSTTHKLK